MTPEEYTKITAATSRQFDEPQTIFPHDMDLLHASLGLVTEAAETADVFKRYLYYGKKIDVTNLKEEAGDLLWYLALMLRTIGSSFDEVMDMNVEKLKSRYPQGFDKEKANHRNITKERKVMEISESGARAGTALHEHPETKETLTANEWATKIGIASRTFRDRMTEFGNVPEIYMRHMSNIEEIRRKNAEAA